MSGAHGIEGRYPFLDPKVVQEFLWLKPELKNAEYKKPVADFLRAHRVPTAWGARSASPPAATPTRRRSRRAPRASRCCTGEV